MIHRVSIFDLVVEDWHWPFADKRRDEIDAYFARQHAANPALWNGRVLLARHPRFTGNRFSARFFETDFASFLAWRDWGFPDPEIRNIFGMGAIRGTDGGFVLGEMAAHTSNAGRIYFPSGTPDLDDINGDRVDIAGSVAREVEEETSLRTSDYTASDIWHCVSIGAAVALVRVLDISCPAEQIRERINANLLTQPNPELCAIHVVYDAAGVTSAMPSFVAAFILAGIT